MGTKINSNYSDLLTFTRASKGHALRPVSYGDELVTNGTFDTDTSNWTTHNNATLSVVSNRLRVTNGATGRAGAGQSFSTTAGQIYRLVFDAISGSSADAFAYVGTAIGNGSIDSIVNVNGTGLEVIFVASSTTTWITFLPALSGSGSYIDFDNISVKEVTFDQPDGTLTLFEHPNNVPRVEWDADRNRLGLLVEESRTNLFINSEAIDSTLTNVQNLTASDEEVSSGIYQGTWRKFTEDTSTSQHRLLGGWIGTVSAGSYSSVSCLVKRISGTRNVQLLVYNGGDNYLATFDLDAETATVSKGGTGTEGTGAIENLGNGIYKISASGIMSTTASQQALIWRMTDGSTSSYTGDGTSSIAVTAVQLEAGSFPTSYIKTTGATATRSADYPIEIDWDNFGYNKKSGTFVVEFDYTDPNNDDSNYLISGGGSARFFYNNASTSSWSIYDGTGGMSVTGIPSDGTPLKISVAMSDAGTTVHRNGTLNSANASISPQDSISYDALAIGGTSATKTLNGHIKSIQYYPRRLTDAQLQALTEPRSTPTLSLTFDGLESSYTENYIHG